MVWITLLCFACSSADAAAKSKKKKRRAAAGPEPTPSSLPVPGTVGGAVPSTRAASVIVIDARSGEILYEKNADESRAPASTLKLLTALVVAERGYLDRNIVVHPSDTQAEPTKLGIKAGETYQRIDLLRALLIKSPNDVARSLARDSAGSTEAFAYFMNAKARELGARNSYFINPNGLPSPGQYSTARDLSIIARAAYANPTIRSIVSMPRVIFRFSNGRTRELTNTNKVLTRLSYCNGMKTGYTAAAGYCLVASGARPGREVIAVVLGGSTRARVWQDASALLSWGLWM